MEKSVSRENKMGYAPVGQLVFSISFPLMISMLVQSLYNIVDGIFVSRISEAALTATSIAYPAQMLMLAVAVGSGVGVNSLLSRKLGQKDFFAVNKVASEGVILSVVSSIVFIALGAAGAGIFISGFTQSPEISSLGASYLRICMLFCPGIFLATTGERLLQATGNTFLSMAAQIAGAVTNIILDPILIFGLFGLPQMGIQGAAAATVIGQWVSAVTALALNHKKNKEIHFNFRNYRPDRQIILEIYKVGIPTMLVQTMGSLMMVGINAILGGFSSAAVAAFGVYYKLWTFIYMPVSGLAQGLLPIIGYNYGAKHGKRIKEAFTITVASAVLMMTVGMIIFQILPDKLLHLYAAGEEMTEIGVPLLKIMSISFPAAAVTITIGFACSALGNGLVSMLSNLLRQLILLVPAVYIFIELWGLSRAWYASWVSEVAALIFAVICFKKEYRKKVKMYCA